MRPRFDPRAGAKRGQLVTIAIGMGVLAALVAFIITGLRAPDAIPGRSYYTVSVALKDTNTLSGHSDVRMGGARVGQTLNPRFENGRAVVDLQLDAKVRPILSDATVRIRPKSAIGQPYVDLSPGRSGNPVSDNGRLPITQSRTAVPLDRVLSTFDAPTRDRFKTLMRELGNSVAGRGEGGGAVSLENGPQMLDATATLTRRVARDGTSIRAFVRNGAELSDTFAGVRQEFADMFGSGDRVMRAIASERVALGQTLETAPGTMQAVTRGLGRLEPALDELGRFADAALPALRLAPRALNETGAMLRQTPRSVPQVERTLRLAGDAVPPTLTLLRSARRTAPWIDGLIKGARPTVAELAPRRCDIVRMARNWQNMFAFGEAGQQGGTGLDLTVTAAGLSTIAGSSPLSASPADIPLPRSLYTEPCKAYYNAELLGGNGG